MNQPITDKDRIREINYQLKSMYINYRFNVNKNIRTQQFELTVFKGTQNISTLKVDSNMSMNQFWIKVKDWMKPVLAYYN